MDYLHILVSVFRGELRGRPVTLHCGADGTFRQALYRRGARAACVVSETGRGSDADGASGIQLVASQPP